MKLKNILVIGLTSLTLASCNDFLDVESPSSYSEEFVFSQKTEINRALNGVYASILVNDLYGKAFQRTFILNSDVEMMISSTNVATHNSYARFDCDDQGSEINKYWQAAYKAIEDANRFIYNLENSPLYNEEDAEIMQMMGEAKCIRAMVTMTWSLCSEIFLSLSVRLHNWEVITSFLSWTVKKYKTI